MHMKRRIVMGALFALPLLAQLVIRLAAADGVITVWPT